ncbi:hypothetical protein C8F04DRAFT_1301696 [Mycena alexandri]|uniref:Uncharacterized protein n=1 Tax=Mycena alexandri TaxID=1745969 RepID=A0AAD6SFX5_9AGAR|nr:hypothetical protein C8F04DRAFT_1301696 [Mycena alexandri]
MDNNTANELAAVKGGPINSLKEPALLVVAKALRIEIKTSGPDKQLIPEIKVVLNAALRNPAFAQREDLQKFIIYPRGIAVAVKNSADKVSEDGVAPGPTALTGAHKKLIGSEATSDPPGQQKILSKGMKKVPASSASEPSEDEGSEPSSPLTSDAGHKPQDDKVPNTESPEDDGNGENPEVPDVEIIVQFQGTDPREVWTPPSQRPKISVVKTADNTYSALLKTLIPVALAQDSPIKKDGKAKLAITGPLGGRLNLGTIDEFDDGGVPETLQLGTLDEYKLKQIPAGLVCNIFWEPKSTVKTEANNNADGIISTELFAPESKPLEFAQQRHAANIAAADAADDPFTSYLQTKLGGPVRPRAILKTIGPMKARYLELTTTMSDLKVEWGDGANFRVTDDHQGAFKGFKFQTSTVQTALHIGHTTTDNDDKLFRYQHIHDDHTNKAQEYVESDKHKALFDPISSTQFTNYIKERKAEKAAEERRELKEQDKKRRREEEKSEKQEKKKRRGTDGAAQKPLSSTLDQ